MELYSYSRLRSGGGMWVDMGEKLVTCDPLEVQTDTNPLDQTFNSRKLPLYTDSSTRSTTVVVAR